MESASITNSDHRQSNLEKQREILLKKRRQKQAHEILSLQARKMNVSLDSNPISPRPYIKSPRHEDKNNADKFAYDGPQAAELDNPDLLDPPIQVLRINNNKVSIPTSGRQATPPVAKTYQAIHIPPIRPVKLPLPITPHTGPDREALFSSLQEGVDYFNVTGAGGDDYSPKYTHSEEPKKVVARRRKQPLRPHSASTGTDAQVHFKNSPARPNLFEIDTTVGRSPTSSDTSAVSSNWRDKSDNQTSSNAKGGQEVAEPRIVQKPRKKRTAKGKATKSKNGGTQRNRATTPKGPLAPRSARGRHEEQIITTTTQTSNSEPDALLDKETSTTTNRAPTKLRKSVPQGPASSKLHPIIRRENALPARRRPTATGACRYLHNKESSRIIAEDDDVNRRPEGLENEAAQNGYSSSPTIQSQNQTPSTKSVTFAPTLTKSTNGGERPRDGLEKSLELQGQQMDAEKVDMTVPNDEKIDETKMVSTVDAVNSFDPEVDVEAFITTPPPEGKPVQCRLSRDKHGVQRGLFPSYFLHLERERDNRLVFLMAARRKRCSAAGSYVISLDATEVSPASGRVVGKLRPNFVGTQFSVGSCFPVTTSHHQSSDVRLGRERVSEEANEIAAVSYERNILGFKGPRKMLVILPEVITFPFGDTTTSKSLLNAWKVDRKAPGIREFRNKKPMWNDNSQSYVLNFHGRVTQASVKNFQIVDQTDDSNVILQFGRISKDIFSMDFKAPLTALQAFGIALSSLVGKLACE